MFFFMRFRACLLCYFLQPMGEAARWIGASIQRLRFDSMDAQAILDHLRKLADRLAEALLEMGGEEWEAWIKLGEGRLGSWLS